MSENVPFEQEARGPFWAPDLPILHLKMLLPRRITAPQVFPFDHPGVHYVHFARNAIYALAQHFGLAGADILVPAYFHGVEIEALVAAGVRPRCFPVRASMRVDPEDVIRCIRPETRAVYLIHYLGFPGPVEALQTICRERGLLLIEDCALALLSAAGSRPLGSFGDAAVFCIYKTLPTVDGGAVVLREGGLAIDGVAPRLSGTAREIAVSVLGGLQRHEGRVGRGMVNAVKAVGKKLTRAAQDKWVPVGTQDFDAADSNLLMSRMSRVILAGQDFERIVAARRRNFLDLQDLLKDLSAPMFDELPEGVCPLFYPFVTAHKHEMWKRLQTHGIRAVLFWLPRQFAPPTGQFPEADELRRTVLELPCHQDMRPEDIKRMAGVVRTLARDIAG